ARAIEERHRERLSWRDRDVAIEHLVHLVQVSGKPLALPEGAAALPVQRDRVARVVVPGDLVLDGEVAVLAEAAPRRAVAGERRPRHRLARAGARVVVPIAHHPERTLRGRPRGDHVVADVTVVDAPPRTLIVGQRQAYGAQV